MSGRVTPDQVKYAYLNSNDSIEAIAAKFGIADRTIYRWMKEDPEGNWSELRKHRRIVPGNFQQAPQPESSYPPPPYPDARPKPRPRRRRGDIDDIEIIELAISDISAHMGGDMADSRGLGSCASALCRLIELRRKLMPPSAADLAEQVIAMGISPTEFVAELKKQWSQSA